MLSTVKHKRMGWIFLGILIGFLLTVFMPAQPLHAVASAGQDGFWLATGLLDNTIEGVYFLDSLTGVLKGAALNVNAYKFTTVFETNVMSDLGIDPSKSPKFMMVSGLAELRRGPTQFQPGLAAVYVLEVNTGTLVAYGVQWQIGRTTQANVSQMQTRFVKLDTIQLRNVAVRP